MSKSKSSFLGLPPEVRRLIYRQHLHHDTTINNPTCLKSHFSLIHTCHQIRKEAQGIFFEINTAIIKLRLGSNPDVEGEDMFCEADCIEHTEDEDFGIIRQFRNLKVVVVCDELEDMEIVESSVRRLCLALLVSNLRTLDIYFDCRKPVDQYHLREISYYGDYDTDNYYDPNDNYNINGDSSDNEMVKRRNWPKHFPNGIWCVLGPFELLRIPFVNIHGVPTEHIQHLRTAMTSNNPSSFLRMLNEQLPGRVKSVNRLLQVAIKRNSNAFFLSVRKEKEALSKIRDLFDKVYYADPSDEAYHYEFPSLTKTISEGSSSELVRRHYDSDNVSFSESEPS